MIQVKSFIFNSFEENTYVLSDETGECVIIDPGCHLDEECAELSEYIEKQGLKPVKLLSTHCHIDHVLGNQYIASKYQIPLLIHPAEKPVLDSSTHVGMMYGIQMAPSPEPSDYLEAGNQVIFGNSQLEVLFTPGHSPGSISFYCKEQQFLISGDVLFYSSIGRTDLPGGNFETLLYSIMKVLMPLGDDVKVFSGHGEMTTLGQERKYNPFLREAV